MASKVTGPPIDSGPSDGASQTVGVEQRLGLGPSKSYLLHHSSVPCLSEDDQKSGDGRGLSLAVWPLRKAGTDFLTAWQLASPRVTLLKDKEGNYRLPVAQPQKSQSPCCHILGWKASPGASQIQGATGSMRMQIRRSMVRWKNICGD